VSSAYSTSAHAVLMGVNVLLQDSTTVTIEDLGHNFFVNKSDVGRNLAEAMVAGVQELNSFTSVRWSTEPVSETPDSFFLDFDIILYGGWSESEAIRLNRLCRSKSPNVSFFWSGVFGEESWFISDFGTVFEYKDDPPRDKEIRKGSSFSLEEILAKKWSDTIAKRIPLSKTYVKSRILSRFRYVHLSTSILRLT
jgi:molybdopterin/thiamine biosynthesis adenylyltransferase